MKTDLMLRIVFGVALLTLFASCGPSTEQTANRYIASTQAPNIIGGHDETLEYAKAHGVVGIYDLEKGGLCTGSLINKNLILTAAHCVNVQKPTKMIVFFAINFDDVIDHLRKGDQSQVRLVEKVSRHAQFGSAKDHPEGSNHDIALIRFKGEVPSDFQKVELAPATLGPAVVGGSLVTLAGYGLNEFQINPEDPEGEPLASSGAGVLRMVENIKVAEVDSKQEEILLDQTEGHGACHGDSGGPAYFKDQATQKAYLLGLTSRGSGSCNEGAIYTDVIGYSQWITDESQKLMK